MRIIGAVLILFAFLGASPLLAQAVPAASPLLAVGDCSGGEEYSLIGEGCEAEALILAGATIALGIAIKAFSTVPTVLTGSALVAAILVEAGAIMFYEDCVCQDFEGGGSFCEEL